MDKLGKSYAASVSLLAAMIFLPIATSLLPLGPALAAAFAASAAAVLIPARALKRAGIPFKRLSASDLGYLAGVDIPRSIAVVVVGVGWTPPFFRTLGAGPGVGAVFCILSIVWVIGLAAAEKWRGESPSPRILSWTLLAGDLLLWLAGMMKLGEASWIEAALFLTAAVGLGAAVLTACLGAAVSSRRFGGEFNWPGSLLHLAPALIGSAVVTAGLNGVVLAAVFIYCLTVLLGSVRLCQRVGPLATWAYVVAFPLNPLILNGLILRLSLILAP
ncbi:MAG TPA: hypothetical protein ENF83_00560 [Candidatus Korarchaeota archaeon]|nr:hypothetical protein [Candidatus Korarchaeota archaeon]